MGNDIWKTLGIQPTSDLTAIKRAYSALARKCNPEDDPDGFRTLHDAYRSALSYAKGAGSRPIYVKPSALKDSVVIVSGDETSVKVPDKEEDKSDSKDQYEWPKFTPASKETKKEEPEEDQYEWPKFTPAPKETKKEEPEEDQYEWPKFTPAPKETKKEEPEGEQYEWPKASDEPDGPSGEGSEDPGYDFSPIADETVRRDKQKNGYVSDLKELIGVFKEINRIKTYKGLAELHMEDKRRLARELFNRYIRLADVSRDTEVWKEFWEEPLVRYFECDPDFRKFILDTLEKKPQNSRERYRIEHFEAVKKLTDNMEGLPVRKLWRDKPKSWLLKPEKDLSKSEKKKATIIKIVFPIAFFIILSLIIFLVQRLGM